MQQIQVSNTLNVLRGDAKPRTNKGDYNGNIRNDWFSCSRNFRFNTAFQGLIILRCQDPAALARGCRHRQKT